MQSEEARERTQSPCFDSQNVQSEEVKERSQSPCFDSQNVQSEENAENREDLHKLQHEVIPSSGFDNQSVPLDESLVEEGKTAKLESESIDLAHINNGDVHTTEDDICSDKMNQLCESPKGYLNNENEENTSHHSDVVDQHELLQDNEIDDNTSSQCSNDDERLSEQLVDVVNHSKEETCPEIISNLNTDAKEFILGASYEDDSRKNSKETELNIDAKEFIPDQIRNEDVDSCLNDNNQVSNDFMGLNKNEDNIPEAFKDDLEFDPISNLQQSQSDILDLNTEGNLIQINYDNEDRNHTDEDMLIKTAEISEQLHEHNLIEVDEKLQPMQNVCFNKIYSGIIY